MNKKLSPILEKHYNEKCQIIEEYAKDTNLQQDVVNRIKYILKNSYIDAYKGSFEEMFLKSTHSYMRRLLNSNNITLYENIKHLVNLILN